MSLADVEQMLPSLTADERDSLLECLCALKEGVSVEEYRRLRTAIEEALHDTSKTFSADEARAELKEQSRHNAAAA